MDSSTKYKKYPSSLDEDKKPLDSRKKPQCLVIVLMLLVIALVTTLVTAVALGVGVGVSVSTESGQSEGLTVTALTPEELQGEYHGLAGGILFRTAVNSSYVSLSITTTRGKLVVNILHSVRLSMTMMGVESTNFLVMENQPGQEKYVDYVIPKNLTNFMQSIMVGQENMSNEVLQQLDNGTVDQTRQYSLDHLAFSQEAVLIFEATEALGSRGIQGSEYPSAMSFYLLALKLLNIKRAETRNYTLNNNGPRRKRVIDILTCPNVNVDVCEQNPPDAENECFGLCGYGCCCWRCVCGDCCVHEYCRSHDQCCADRGFFSFACLSVVWRVLGSLCSQTYDC